VTRPIQEAKVKGIRKISKVMIVENEEQKYTVRIPSATITASQKQK
jgi:hypothetical protein